MSDTDRFAKLENLFEQVRDLETNARKAFLDHECINDADLRHEVEKLLAHHDRGGMLDDPIDITNAQEEYLPESVGRYQVLECLGRGGMGVVYRAEQDQPQRQVALKMMHAGLRSKDLQRRFEFESSVLARLQHPGIAQIFEVATWDDGNGARPFFAMELVEGVALDQFVKEKHSIEAKLRLFIAICEAVHHAHQKGVIHRDLKPANIMITHDGVPKILDFGVARTTDADLQATMYTLPGQLVGTLTYMSPEQINSDSSQLDTRSDVYALGVILYELLAGQLPYDLADKSLAQVARIINEREPRSLASHDRKLRGDLTTIVSKALEKEPERRYASVFGLISDLRRFLAHEPIAARPASAVYQMTKFAQRNKTIVGGMAAMIVILLSATIVLSWQSARINTEARTRQDVANFLREMLTSLDPAKTAGEPLTVRDMLDDASLRLENSFETVPSVRADLQGTVGSTYHLLGEYEQAEYHYRQAVNVLTQEHGIKDEKTLKILADFGLTLKELDRLEEAESILRDALSHIEDPVSPIAIKVRRFLAIVMVGMGRTEEADALFRYNYNSLLHSHGDKSVEVASEAINLGSVLMDSKRHDEALPLLEESLATLRRELGDDDPVTISAINNVSAVYHNLGREEDSNELLREAVERSTRVLGPVHLHTLRRRHNMVRGAMRRGDYEASIAETANTVAICEQELGPTHSETLTWVEMLVTGLAFGRSMEEAEQVALSWYERLESEHGPTSRSAGRMAYLVMNLYDSWGKEELEAEWLRRAKTSVYIPPDFIMQEELPQ